MAQHLKPRVRNYRLVPHEVQESIFNRYRDSGSTSSMADLAEESKLPKSTIQHIIERGRQHDGDPVQPRGHAPRILTEKQEAMMCAKVDQHPGMTNRQLADGLVAVRTVSTILARADPPIRTKVFVDQEPEEYTDKWKAAMTGFLAKLRHISLCSRIYADETPIFANEAKTTGRGRRGQVLLRARSRYAKKYTLHVFLTQERVIYWELRNNNADDLEVKTVALKAVKYVTDQKVLLWDQLGRSGRCKCPVAQHFNPEVVAAFNAVGVQVMHLPPKGKYLDPAELLFNDLKSHYIRPAFSLHGDNLSRMKLVRIINEYCRSVTSDTLTGFFARRANGKELNALELLT